MLPHFWLTCLGVIGLIQLVQPVCYGVEPITKFAERQLDQMLEDRPDMRDVLGADDPVYHWVASRLDVGNPYQRVHWFSLEPERGAAAQHGAESSQQPAHVRVTSSQECTGEDRWLLVIYELHNLENTHAFRKLQKMALDGKLSEDQFAEHSVLIELCAKIQTKRTLANLIVPGHCLARSKGYLHFMSLPDEEPVEITDADRVHCKENLDHARAWYRLAMLQKNADDSKATKR